MANTALGDGRTFVDVTTNKTVALTDSGTVQNVTATGVTITLLATIAGASYTIRNGGLAPTGAAVGAASGAAVTVTIAPNASDQIAGLGFTATDAKSVINTLGNVGDEIKLVADATNGWVIQEAKGTWTRQA